MIEDIDRDVFVRIRTDLLVVGDSIMTDRHHASNGNYEDDDPQNQIGGIIPAFPLSGWLRHGMEETVQEYGGTACHLVEANANFMKEDVYDRDLNAGYHEKCACTDDPKEDDGCVVFDLFGGFGGVPGKLMRRPIKFNPIWSNILHAWASRRPLPAAQPESRLPESRRQPRTATERGDRRRGEPGRLLAPLLSGDEAGVTGATDREYRLPRYSQDRLHVPTRWRSELRCGSHRLPPYQPALRRARTKARLRPWEGEHERDGREGRPVGRGVPPGVRRRARGANRGGAVDG